MTEPAIPDAVWATDPQAEEALHRFLESDDYCVGHMAEILCVGHGHGGRAARSVGGVWRSEMRLDSLEHLIIRLWYWPQGAEDATDVRCMCRFLYQSGDEGMFWCPTHGSFKADLRWVRERIEEQYLLRDHLVIPVWPPGLAATASIKRRDPEVEATLDDMVKQSATGLTRTEAYASWRLAEREVARDVRRMRASRSDPHA